MPHGDSSSPPARAPRTPRSARSNGLRRRTRRPLAAALVGAAGLVFVLGHMGTPTTPYRDGAGRVHRVLAHGPWNFAGVDRRNGRWHEEKYLLFRYYSDAETPEQMRVEAQTLAPELFAAADSLNLSVLLVQPSWPLLWEPLPIVIKSVDVRYRRNAAGQWIATR